jgi:Peptidase inhibitor I78 family
MTRSFAILPLAALALACTPAPTVDSTIETPAGETTMPAPETPMDGMMVCDAAAVQNLVGKPYTEAVGKDAQARSKSKSMRLIRPGMAVTMDFRNDRLNIEVDEKNAITAVRCG